MFWVIAVALVVIATTLVTRSDSRVVAPAFGQATSSAGLRGVFAFSGQLSKNSYGCDLPPDVVEQMIADQRKYRLQSSEGQAP